MGLHRWISLMLILVGLGAPARLAAQLVSSIPIQTQVTVDQNGVDLVSGSFNFSHVDLGFASSAGTNLKLTTVIGSAGIRESTYGAAYETTENGQSYVYAAVGGANTKFLKVGSTYSPVLGDGAAMAHVAGANTYLLTYRDGTTVELYDEVINKPYTSVVTTYIDHINYIQYPNGERLTFTYLQLAKSYCNPKPCQRLTYNRLQSITSNLGYQLRFSYQANTLGTDPENNSDFNLRTGVTAVNLSVDNCDPAALGCTYTQSWPYLIYSSYDANSSSIAYSDQLGRTTAYTQSYSAITIQKPSSSSAYLTANLVGGSVSSIVSPAGTWTYASSVSGTMRTMTATDPAGHARVVVSDQSTGLVASDTDANGHTLSYTYDSSGRLLTATAPEGNYTTYTYDGRGNVTQTVTTPKAGSGQTAISTSASYPTSCTSTFTCNEVLTTTDARGGVTNYTYDDAHGGVTSVTAPAAANGVRPQTRYGYTAFSGVYRLTSTSTCQTTTSCTGSADEVRTQIGYGTNARPASVATGSGDGALTATSTLGYDVFSNVLTVDGPLPGSADTVRYVYDAVQQRVGVIGPDPDGGGPLQFRAVRYTYNLDGQVTRVERGTTAGQSDGNWAGFQAIDQVATAYDAAGRKVSDTLTGGGSAQALVQYGYDTVGRLECTAQRMNPSAYGTLPAACSPGTEGAYGPDRISRQTFDNGGRVLQTLSAYGTTVQRAEAAATYTPNGKVATVADGKGNLTTYVYDGFDRLSQTQFPAPGSAGSSNSADYEQLYYDAGGNVVAKRLRDGRAVGFGIDALNHTTFVAPPSGDSTDVPSSFIFDNLGRMISAGDQNAHTERLTYDALGRAVNEIGTWQTKSMQYDLAGRRTRLTWQDGFYVTYDYDVAGAMTAIHENGGAVLASYTYDDLGRRTAASFGNGTQRSYSYDAASRLGTLNWTIGGSAGNALTFAYNPAGQIMSRTASNDAYAWTQSYNVDRPYAVNGLNQYTQSGSVTPSYDTRGNLTAAGNALYTYNTKNLMSSATGVPLYYDPVGRLDQMVQSNLLFDYSGTQLITELNANAGVLRRYVFGPGTDEPVVWYEGAGTGDKRWLHADERGSIVAVTNAAGNMLAVNAYDEYGIPQSTNMGRFQYTGQTWLPEIGLYNYKARMYSPTLGRFLQTDPIGYGDGLNWHNYAHSDPVNASDPSGLDEVDITVTGHRMPSGPELPSHQYISPAESIRRNDAPKIEGGNTSDAEPQSSCSGSATAAAKAPAAAASRSAIVEAAEAAAEVAEAAALRALGALGALLSLSGDTPQRYVNHYTTIAGYRGITTTGSILPSRDGYVYVTPDTYNSGSTAQASLALGSTPNGYFRIPASDVPTAGPPGPVTPANGQPGGGTEMKVPNPVPVANATFVPICR